MLFQHVTLKTNVDKFKKTSFHRRSLACAHRHTCVCLSLDSELPFSGVLTPQRQPQKNHPLRWSYWWALRGSNSRPSRCKRDALPAELSAHPVFVKFLYTLKFQKSSLFFIKLSLFYIFSANSISYNYKYRYRMLLIIINKDFLFQIIRLILSS